MARSSLVPGLLALLVVACSNSPAGPDAATTVDTGVATDTGTRSDAGGSPDAALSDVPDGALTDGASDGAPDGAVDSGGGDLGGDLGADAVDTDVTDGGGATTDAGTLNGYIRFLNVSAGAGTVRFVAVNQPGFSPSYIEAVVSEGGSSGYIETQPVAYFINVVADPGAAPGVVTDGGVGDGGAVLDGAVTDGGPTLADAGPTDAGPTDASAGTLFNGQPRLADQITSDVYFRSGCTAILAGSPSGTAADQTDRRLWRISDIPMRTSEPGIGLVRVVGAVPLGPPLDIDEGTTALAHLVQYFEPTGFRRVSSGTRHYAVRNDDNGFVLLPDLAVTVAEGQPHTLYLWGLAGADAGPAQVHGLLTNDLPPGR